MLFGGGLSREEARGWIRGGNQDSAQGLCSPWASSVDSVQAPSMRLCARPYSTVFRDWTMSSFLSFLWAARFTTRENSTVRITE